MKQVFGGLLLGCGILIAGLSGLCSILVLSDETDWSWAAAKETLSIVGIIGGIPFVIGLGMAFLGWHLLRRDPQPPAPGQIDGGMQDGGPS